MVPAIKKTAQKNRKKKQFGTSGFIFRFIGGIIFSLIIAGGVSALAVKVLGGTVALGIEFTGTAKTILLFGTFAVTFLISVGVIAYRLMRKITVKAKPAVKSAAPKSPQQPKKTKKTEMSLFAVAFVLVTRQFMMIAGALKTVNRPRNEEKAAAKTPAIPAASAAPAPPPAPVTPEVEEEPLSPESEKLKNYLMNFLTRAIGSDKNNPDTMDNFHRFGTSLYLAGASEVLTTHGQIAPHVHVKILADCLLTLKFKKSHAMSLAERYEEYLLADDRYMQMFQTGRKAIDVYLSDETTAGRLLDAALEEWGRPKTV